MEFLVTLAAIVALAVPGRTNANASIASAGDRVVIAWAASAPAGDTDIYAAASTDAGRTFGAPVRVNDVAGEARVTGEQPPRVAVRGAEIAVSWVSKRDGTTIRLARSTDGGRTFSASRAVSKAGAPGSRGWEAMTIDSRGDVEIAWLDHRDMATSATHDAPHQMDAATHGTADGAAMAQRSGFYVARVPAGPAQDVQPEQRVTTGVCYCCKTAIVAAGDGAIVAAWRHVYPGNIRDIAFSRAADGRTFSPPVRVSSDQWQLDGCPDDGPAIALDAANLTHIVWPTMTKQGAGGEPTLAIFFATSRDGRTFTPREKLPTEGVAHHPQIAIERDGTVAVTWDEMRDGARHVVLALGRTDAAGRAHFAREPLGESEPGVYPVAGAVRDGLVVAWTAQAADGSVIRVQRIDAGGAATKSR
jgi:hypothetical protein